MSNCENCGGSVSASFARVYGDNNNTVHRCINCVEQKDGGRRILRVGGGAIKNKDVIQHRLSNEYNC